MQEQSEEVSMRRIVVSEFVTLDGVVEDPSWTFQSTGREWEMLRKLTTEQRSEIARKVAKERWDENRREEP